MKSIIIYHSQSGSTRKIAQAIKAGIEQAVEKCDIATFKEVDPRDTVKYDLIGLGSPVWRNGASGNMTAFIEGLSSPYMIDLYRQLLMRKYFFVFCCHGAQPGEYMAKVVPALKRKGLTVIGWNDWYGNVILPYMPKPYYTDGHPDEIDLKEAKDFGREIAERSHRISRGETHLIPILPEGRAYIEIYGENLPEMSDEQKKSRMFEFKVNGEKCTQCGLCADSCPTNSIDCSLSPPIFRSNCDRCWFCEQICPVGAIEVDWQPVAAGIKNASHVFLERLLEVAEAKGRFRRLVPVEDIDWDNPLYKQRKPPRILI